MILVHPIGQCSSRQKQLIRWLSVRHWCGRSLCCDWSDVSGSETERTTQPHMVIFSAVIGCFLGGSIWQTSCWWCNVLRIIIFFIFFIFFNVWCISQVFTLALRTQQPTTFTFTYALHHVFTINV